MTTDELVDLWWGDQDTTGVKSIRLVQAVCRQARPKRILELAERFYPGVPWPEIPEPERKVLEAGFNSFRFNSHAARAA